jgi:chemotaxis protein MotB
VKWQQINFKRKPEDVKQGGEAGASAEEEGAAGDASHPEGEPSGEKPCAPPFRTAPRSRFLNLERLREERDVDWTLPWSDLMMTMFVLFVTLYVYEVETSAARDVPEPARPDFATVPPPTASYPATPSLEAQIESDWGGAPDLRTDWDEESTLRAIVDVRELRLDETDDLGSVDLLRKSAYRIVLTGDVLFDPGKAVLREDALPALQKAAKQIGTTPYMVNVVGHTDAMPIHSTEYPSNWELSVARAAVVARFLIFYLDLPATQFYVSGHADNQPMAPNETARDRAKNRRVEIVVTREIPSGGDGA